MAKHKAKRLKDAAKHHSSISAYVTRNSARPNAAAATNSTNTNNNDTPGRSVTNNVATSTAEDGTSPGEVDVASVTAPAPDADVNVANNNDQIATTNNNNAAAQDDTTTNTAAQDSDNGDNDDVSNWFSVCQSHTTKNVSHCIVLYCLQQNDDLEDNEYWNAASMDFFSQVKKEIDNAVNYRGRARTGRTASGPGPAPRWRRRGRG